MKPLLTFFNELVKGAGALSELVKNDDVPVEVKRAVNEMYFSLRQLDEVLRVRVLDIEVSAVDALDAASSIVNRIQLFASADPGDDAKVASLLKEIADRLFVLTGWVAQKEGEVGQGPL